MGSGKLVDNPSKDPQEGPWKFSKLLKYYGS